MYKHLDTHDIMIVNCLFQLLTAVSSADSSDPVYHRKYNIQMDILLFCYSVKGGQIQQKTNLNIIISLH